MAKTTVNKTCSVYVLLKNEIPVKIYQTEWFPYSRSFSMSGRDMFSFMSGVCNGLGVEYSFDCYNPDTPYNCCVEEV